MMCFNWSYMNSDPKQLPKPLNGTKTHPLSDHAREVLRAISVKPIPRLEVNPGVVNRLMRGALVELNMIPSSQKMHNGRDVLHLCITDAGRAELQNTES